MRHVLDNIEAEQVFSEMSRRGIKPHQRVRVAFPLMDLSATKLRPARGIRAGYRAYALITDPSIVYNETQ